MFTLMFTRNVYSQCRARRVKQLSKCDNTFALALQRTVSGRVCSCREEFESREGFACRQKFALVGRSLLSHGLVEQGVVKMLRRRCASGWGHIEE